MEQQFFHVRMIVGVVVGLSITNVLKGIARFIVHPEKEKPYWLHLLWTTYFLVLLVHFWWWEFDLRHLPAWEFTDYLYVVVFSTFFYILSALLFPEHLDEYDGFRGYYKLRSPWFFGVFALVFALDVVDSAIKGSVHLRYLGIEYFIGVVIHIALCVALMRIRDQRFHAIVACVFIVYQFIWIYRAYRWLDQAGRITGGVFPASL